jgi:hypothetical protein
LGRISTGSNQSIALEVDGKFSAQAPEIVALEQAEDPSRANGPLI